MSATGPVAARDRRLGCGKSSLVRAGLIPAVLRGRFHDGRSWVTNWRIAVTRPGSDPFGELAESPLDLASRKDRSRFPHSLESGNIFLKEETGYVAPSPVRCPRAHAPC